MNDGKPSGVSQVDLHERDNGILGVECRKSSEPFADGAGDVRKACSLTCVEQSSTEEARLEYRGTLKCQTELWVRHVTVEVTKIARILKGVADGQSPSMDRALIRAVQ